MLIAAAILSVLAYGVMAAMLGTVMPVFTTQFHLSGGQNGNIALAQALGLVIASLLAGPLIDARGKKTALVGGLLLITGALICVPSARGYVPLLLLYFNLGIGGGVMVTAVNALASDVGQERRASMLNFLNLFFGLGGLLTPFLAANLLHGDLAKLCYLGAGLCVAAIVANVVANIPPPAAGKTFRVSALRAILRRPVTYLLALFVFLYIACEVGVWNWLASYLISRQIQRATALNIVSLGFALGMLVGRMVVSRILLRVPSITVTLASSVLMAATTFAMLQSPSATLAGIFVFCAGLAMAPVFPTTLAMVAEAFPLATPTAMGIVIACGWLGSVVSSPIIGAGAGKDNIHLGTALLLLPACSVAMVGVNLAMRPMLKVKR